MRRDDPLPASIGARDYFRHARPEVRDLVPDSARRVLDVGCGAGALGGALKTSQPGRIVVGIELLPAVAAIASRVLDEVHQGEAEEILSDLRRKGSRFDAIVFADILEHLADPWSALELARDLLASEGRVVASIPNIRNIRILYRLLVRGEWTYEDEGILDRGHLRFFTRRTIEQAFLAAGFEIEELQALEDGGWRGRIAAALGALAIGRPHRRRELSATQFLLRARKAA
jgi:2-polyprenyl-3-methyl-5-hydroxy-6-metoxy-1,4-benzoquinol methylase